MPIYIYTCDNCGFSQEQFLNADKQSIQITCKRCLKQATANQIREKDTEFKQTGDVIGTLKHEGN